MYTAGLQFLNRTRHGRIYIINDGVMNQGIVVVTICIIGSIAGRAVEAHSAAVAVARIRRGRHQYSTG